eukprot:5117511-Amphidinium_carterae.2
MKGARHFSRCDTIVTVMHSFGNALAKFAWRQRQQCQNTNLLDPVFVQRPAVAATAAPAWSTAAAEQPLASLQPTSSFVCR